MAYFLVDYENVNVAGMNGLKNLNEEDTLIIFYSENASTMTFGLHRRLTETKAIIEYHNVNVGTKNALDFQLSSHLGYLIGICPEPQNEHFYIVSKDNGFQVLQQYWHRIKISISIISQISEANSKNVSKVKESPDITQMQQDIQKVPETPDFTQMLSVVPGISEHISQIINIINTCKTKVKLNTELNRLIRDGKKVSAVHSAIKSYVKTLPVE